MKDENRKQLTNKKLKKVKRTKSSYVITLKLRKLRKISRYIGKYQNYILNAVHSASKDYKK